MCAVSYTTTQGVSVYLDCNPTDVSDNKASWWKMTQKNYTCFEKSLEESENTVLHKNFTLELRNVSRDDDGIYTCTYLDEPIANYCLFVIGIPTMSLTINDVVVSGTISAILGQKYVLQCAALGADPPVNLTWSYNNIMYNKDERKPSVNVAGNGSNSSTTSLGLVPIKVGSSNVTCLSNGRYPQQGVMSTLEVNVYAIPKLFFSVNDTRFNGTLLAGLHRKYDIKCIAKGAYPKVNLTWTPKNEDFFVEEYNHSSCIRDYLTYDCVISFRYMPNQTGSSNITCSSSGMHFSQNLNHTLQVQVYVYQEQNMNYTLHVETYAQPVFANWMFWFGLAVFLLWTTIIGILVRYKAGKCNTPQEYDIYYRGTRLSSKSSTFESLRKRESGSIPLMEIKQKDCNFEVDTTDKVKREDISVMTLIPSKSFLKYFRGSYERSGKRGYVLVKTVKEYAYVKDIYTFVQYSRLMELLPQHENVVALLGISDEDMPIYSYHEYVECLNLRNYMLRNYQSSGLPASSTILRNSSDSRENNITIELYEFAENVARGMCFLISQNFKHPALSLRKVLLSSSGQCKLYDIWPESMSSDRIRYLLQRKDPPLAWMAPESIFLGQYHLNTDVWSYGVFLWELFSFGETPFKNMSTFEIENEVRNSRNLPMPPNCTGAIFNLMLSSWDKDAQKRPPFDNILKQLSSLLQNIQCENYDQTEVDEILERNSQDHKYFTLEGQSSDS